MDADDDDTNTCECCGYVDPVGGLESCTVQNADGSYSHNGPRRWLCQICANTPIADIAAQPTLYETPPELAEAIAWIGNRLRRDIAGEPPAAGGVERG